MTRKHGIRAPRKPRGEDPAVTIANQARQIKVLIDRCSELSEARDAAMAEADISDGLAKFANERAEKLECVIARMEGWRDCAREILGMGLDIIAPGA